MPAPDPLQADLDLLRGAAADAGKIALRWFGKDPQVWMKGGTSPVSEADYAVDTFLRETLTAARPDYGWLSEETRDNTARLQSRRQFIVDPIDGTRGFLDGRKTWCVSVAVVEDGRSLVGVLDCPATGEVFHATRDGGAWKDGARLSVVGTDRAGPLKIGGPDSFFKLLPSEWRARGEKSSYIPSLAYRLAMVADGRLDGTFVKPSARDWDLAAAALIVSEAGGALLDAHGKAPLFGAEETAHGPLAVGSGELLQVMAKVIAGPST